MKRCYYEKDSRYQHYGQRGITVCEEWHDFWSFFLWASRTYVSGKTLDRKNNNSGYSPDNCQWADASEQMRNRRTTEKLKTHLRKAREVQYRLDSIQYGDPQTRQQKLCSSCKECKPLEFFHRLTKSKDGRNSYCKQCSTVLRGKWVNDRKQANNTSRS